MERGKQIAYKYDGSQIYERHKAYDQTWTAWNGYATKSDLGNIGPYKIMDYNTSNLNNPPNAIILHTTQNPIGYPQSLEGNTAIVIQLFPGRDVFSAQLAFGFGTDKLAYRRKTNSANWTAWKYFTAS